MNEDIRKEKGLPEPEEEKKDAAEGTAGQNAETKKAETESTGTDAAKAEKATKGKAIDVTIGEQVMTSTDPTFKPLAFEDSLQEAKEQTAPAQDTAKEPAESAKEETSAQEKPDAPQDPKDPPQGPVGLFSHRTL